MDLKSALKSSIELCLLATVVDVIALYVLFQYIAFGTVQIRLLVHAGIPALMELAVYIIAAVIYSYGAVMSVKGKLD